MAHTIVTAESSVKPKEAADRRKAGDFQRVESGVRKIEVRRLGTADMSVFNISMQEPVLHRVRVARQDAADMDTDWIDHLMLAVDQAVPRLLEIQDTAADARVLDARLRRAPAASPPPGVQLVWPQPASLSARMAAAKATAVKRTKAIASTVTPTASPTPIVAYRSTSMCHVIGFANAAIRNIRGSGSRG